jgi:hypothetical protein
MRLAILICPSGFGSRLGRLPDIWIFATIRRASSWLSQGDGKVARSSEALFLIQIFFDSDQCVVNRVTI